MGFFTAFKIFSFPHLANSSPLAQGLLTILTLMASSLYHLFTPPTLSYSWLTVWLHQCNVANMYDGNCPSLRWGTAVFNGKCPISNCVCTKMLSFMDFTFFIMYVIWAEAEIWSCHFTVYQMFEMFISKEFYWKSCTTSFPPLEMQMQQNSWLLDSYHLFFNLVAVWDLNWMKT